MTNSACGIKKSLDNTNSLSSARREIENGILKKLSRAKVHYSEFHLSWTDARLPNEEIAIVPIHLKDYLTPEIVLDSA